MKDKITILMCATLAGAAMNAAAATVTINAGDVDALFTAMTNSTAEIILKPGVYDLTGRDVVSPKGVWGGSVTDKSAAYLVYSRAGTIRGENTKPWRQKTREEESIIKCDNAQARLLYCYSDGRNGKYLHLSFEGGNAKAVNDGTFNDTGFGGALRFLDASRGYASNCVFRGSTSVKGGATHAVSTYDSYYTNCTASSGGGAYANGATSNYNAPTNIMSGCVFADCKATNGSGGGLLFENCQVYDSERAGYVDNCFFTNCTATSYGGAIFEQNAGLIKNSTFVGCSSPFGAVSASAYGKNFYNSKISNCVFTANSSTGNGGAVGYWNRIEKSAFTANSAVNGGAVRSKEIVDSAFTNNVASGSGGVASYHSDYPECAARFYDCTFVGNTAASNGGAVDGAGLRQAFVSNCLFFANSSKGNAGACAYAKVYDSQFHSNTTANSGGACYAVDAVACHFATNSAKYGGACHSVNAVNCSFITNSVTENGGACCGCTASRCVFHSNVARNYGGGAYSGQYTNCVFVGNNTTGARGGGLSHAKAYRCAFTNNFVGTSARATGANCSHCYDCIFSGTSNVSGGTVTRCEFDHVENVPGRGISFIFDAVRNGYVNFAATNCLIHHCSAESIINSEGEDMEIVNCTFAHNVCSNSYNNESCYMIKASRGTDYQKIGSDYRYFPGTNKIVNCIFTGNVLGYGKNRSDADLRTYIYTQDTNFGRCALTISNCLFTAGENLADPIVRGNLVQAPARFAEGTYVPRHGSKAINLGRDVVWPADATDFAGNPRVRDGQVDAGCYESTLPPIGCVFFVR